MVERGDAFEVKGRGELQMGVLIETMRREGYELSVSPPRVIFRAQGSGPERKILEPIEEVTIDCDHEHAGVIIEKMGLRKGNMESYSDSGDRARLIFTIPTRGLLGYPAEFKSDVSTFKISTLLCWKLLLIVWITDQRTRNFEPHFERIRGL
jgi:GTP-binding protein